MTATDDDFDDEAAPARRPLPLRAQPAEPIPDAINADFLDALAVERALSSARNLASGVSGTAEARRAVWGHAPPPRPSWPTPEARRHLKGNPDNEHAHPDRSRPCRFNAQSASPEQGGEAQGRDPRSAHPPRRRGWKENLPRRLARRSYCEWRPRDRRPGPYDLERSS
jgi:hypothetical protein